MIIKFVNNFNHYDKLYIILQKGDESMSRTAEIVLSIIGAVFFALMLCFSGLILAFQDSQDFKDAFKTEFEAQQTADVDTQIDVNKVMDILSGATTYFIIVSIIAMILGILAVVLLKGNKKPKAAGIILLITGILTAVLTIGFSFLPSLLYLIAGILALVRKPKQTEMIM